MANSPLTCDLICRAFVARLAPRFGSAGELSDEIGETTHTSRMISVPDDSMRIDQFIAEVIEPAADELAGMLPTAAKFRQQNFPNGVVGAQKSLNGVVARCIPFYDIETDKQVFRVDVSAHV